MSPPTTPEKLDDLYSDTNAGGFLDSTSTPSPWHQYRAEVTAAERVRFVDGSVSIPSTMTLPAGASAASLGGFARVAPVDFVNHSSCLGGTQCRSGNGNVAC